MAHPRALHSLFCVVACTLALCRYDDCTIVLVDAATGRGGSPTELAGVSTGLKGKAHVAHAVMYVMPAFAQMHWLAKWFGVVLASAHIHIHCPAKRSVRDQAKH